MADVQVGLDPDTPACIRVVFVDATTGDEAIAIMDFPEAQALIAELVDLLRHWRRMHRRGLC
jgi:hypothetical protein